MNSKYRYELKIDVFLDFTHHNLCASNWDMQDLVWIFQGTKRKDSMDSDTSRGGGNKMTNQFSFLERATQTMNNAMKVIF